MLVVAEEADTKLTFADRETGLTSNLTIEDLSQLLGLFKAFPEVGLLVTRSDCPRDVGLLAVNRMLVSTFHQGMRLRLNSGDGLGPRAGGNLLGLATHLSSEGQERRTFLLKLLVSFPFENLAFSVSSGLLHVTRRGFDKFRERPCLIIQGSGFGESIQLALDSLTNSMVRMAS